MKTVSAKFTIVLFLLYIFFYKEALGEVRVFLYGGAALVVITTVIYLDKKNLYNFKLPMGISLSYFYGIYSLIVGLIVAVDKSLLVSSVVTYFALLFICTCIYIVSKGEQSVDWLINVLIFICIICALYTLLNGYDYYNGIIVKTMGQNNNPNTLGTLMVFGIFAILYKNERKPVLLVISFILIGLFIYIIILTGSKKSLFSAGIFFIIWIGIFVKDMHKKGNANQRMIAYTLLIIAIIVGITYFKNEYMNTASYQRFMHLYNSGSTKSRESMYLTAVNLFKQNPIFGVGYNQFRVVSGWSQYAHSTYAEVLSDSGFLGSVIYFAPIILTMFIIIGKLYKKKSYKLGLIGALFCVEIFLGAVNIFMYDPNHLLMWTIIYMTTEYYDLFNSKRKE